MAALFGVSVAGVVRRSQRQRATGNSAAKPIGGRTLPVIPDNPTRKRLHPFDECACTARNLIERTFCRLKDYRRIATRYDKLAGNFAAAIALVATLIRWT